MPSSDSSAEESADLPTLRLRQVLALEALASSSTRQTELIEELLEKVPIWIVQASHTGAR